MGQVWRDRETGKKETPGWENSVWLLRLGFGDCDTFFLNTLRDPTP